MGQHGGCTTVSRKLQLECDPVPLCRGGMFWVCMGSLLGLSLPPRVHKLEPNGNCQQYIVHGCKRGLLSLCWACAELATCPGCALPLPKYSWNRLYDSHSVTAGNALVENGWMTFFPMNRITVQTEKNMTLENSNIL